VATSKADCAVVRVELIWRSHTAQSYRHVFFQHCAIAGRDQLVWYRDQCHGQRRHLFVLSARDTVRWSRPQERSASVGDRRLHHVRTVLFIRQSAVAMLYPIYCDS
jgi:hypothetical protein